MLASDILLLNGLAVSIVRAGWLAAYAAFCIGTFIMALRFHIRLKHKEESGENARRNEFRMEPLAVAPIAPSPVGTNPLMPGQPEQLNSKMLY